MKLFAMFITSLIAAFSALWTIVEATGFFFERSTGLKIKTWNEGFGFWVLVGISVLFALTFTWIKGKTHASNFQRSSDLNFQNIEPRLQINDRSVRIEGNINKSVIATGDKNKIVIKTKDGNTNV